MPRVNIYIRKDDEAKWNAIKSKPEWMHQHINATEWVEGPRRHTKAKPGTIDPITGFEIEEFITNADPKVDEYMASLYEPKELPEILKNPMVDPQHYTDAEETL